MVRLFSSLLVPTLQERQIAVGVEQNRTDERRNVLDNTLGTVTSPVQSIWHTF